MTKFFNWLRGIPNDYVDHPRWPLSVNDNLPQLAFTNKGEPVRIIWQRDAETCYVARTNSAGRAAGKAWLVRSDNLKGRRR